MQILNYISGAAASSLPSSSTLKTTVISLSTTVSILGIASGILSKNSGLLGVSVLFGSTSCIAWMDLGASEHIKSYKESILKQGKEEKREGEIVQNIDRSVNGLADKISKEKSELEAITEANRSLKLDLEKSKQSIFNLRKGVLESSLQIAKLNKSISSQKKIIDEITSLNESLREAEKTAAAIHREAIQTIRDLETFIVSLEGRVVDLEKELAPFRKKST